MTDDGAVISASKLTVPQLKAELKARGLSSEGKRVDLYRRVQASSFGSVGFRVIRECDCMRSVVLCRGAHWDNSLFQLDQVFHHSCSAPVQSEARADKVYKYEYYNFHYA